MIKRLLVAVVGLCCVAAQAGAQQRQTVTGRVTGDEGAPLSGVAVVVRGTTIGTTTGPGGTYSIAAAPGQVLVFRRLGTSPQERSVGAGTTVINVQLHSVAANLNAVVVTALGRQVQARSLGTSQQSVQGPAIAQTQRENFVNALQGRVAGVQVTNTSGVPGASSSITIRGVSSISGSNQPLIILDGLPMDNTTLNTAAFASDAPGSTTAFNNRGVDFTNRAADINPEDIESVVVLKGPEASALYGIQAGNGAIVITTKRGHAGSTSFEYTNDFRLESLRGQPKVQQTYGLSTAGGDFTYFGTPYTPGTTFYNNISGFFQNGFMQKHNLAFSGGTSDSRINYRISTGLVRDRGVVPNSDYSRVNLTGTSQAKVTSWLNTDLSIIYAYDNNDQPFKGAGGPLIGLLLWPTTDKASDWLTPSGQRRRLTTLYAGSEIDNPYFNVNRNRNNAKTNRTIANLGVTVLPFSWGNIKSNVGVDAYTGQNLLDRDPQSAYAYSQGGILDVADNVTRRINAQTLFNVNEHHFTKGFSISGLLGNAIRDDRSTVDALAGQNFLDPNFVSINNTSIRSSLTTDTRYRVVSGFGQATANFRDYLFVNVTGRNDWTSTIPRPNNSFFYPSVSVSYIFTDAFPSLQSFMTGKLRGAIAEAGKDAPPYAYSPALEYKTTSYGGYGYGFYGPNPNLRPEFAKSAEFGTELSFLHDRLGFDMSVYRKTTQNQIVQNIRGSYATGFILFNLNGATTRNNGVEATLRLTPVQRDNFSWDVLANFDHHHGKVLSLPRNLPESYVSDTWLYGNVRAGTAPGLSTESLTGLYYQRVDSGPAKGQILIDPTTGLPLRTSTFVNRGYDRTPKYTVGLTNTVRLGNFSLSGLLDFRRGGDIFDATDQFLTTRGLATSTLDRNTPRVVRGVLRDGKQNTANPTYNNIVVVPSQNTNYYAGMSEELFIQKNINWVWLRDVTLTYRLPPRLAKNASVYVTGTDLFLKTNYTGLDPVTNGNSAAVGGSGGAGIDYGNFPLPRGFNFGLKLGW